MVTSNYSEALCIGATTPAAYIARASSAVSLTDYANGFLQNPTVRDRLCNADVLIVTGSASSSPSEQNTTLPRARANSWASVLGRHLTTACSGNLPTVLPLSLGIAGCKNISSNNQTLCDPLADQPADRQIVILAAKQLGDTPLSRKTIETTLSNWLSTLPQGKTNAPLLARLIDPEIFNLNELTWTDNNSAAQINIPKNRN